MRLFEVLKPLLEGRKEWIIKNMGDKIIDAAKDDRSISDSMEEFNWYEQNKEKYDYERAKASLLQFIVGIMEPMDPTPNNKYLQWIARRYVNGEFQVNEDVTSIYGALVIFDEYKKHLDKKDINQYKTLADLYSTIREFKHTTLDELEEQERLEKVAKKEQQLIQSGDLEVYYRSEDERILVPRTLEASQLIGREKHDTEWCTNNSGAYSSYTEDGPLYVIETERGDNPPYQVHFESEQFMDRDDSPVSYNDLSDSPAVEHLMDRKKVDFIESNNTVGLIGMVEMEAIDEEEAVDIIANDMPDPELPHGLVKEEGRFYLMVDDLEDLAEYIQTGDVIPDFPLKLLSGDAFEYFETDFSIPIDSLYFKGRLDEYHDQIIEEMNNILREAFGDNVNYLFDETELSDINDLFQALNNLNDDPEDRIENVPNGLPIQPVERIADELVHVIKMTALQVLESDSEAKAFNHVMELLKDVGIDTSKPRQWDGDFYMFPVDGDFVYVKIRGELFDGGHISEYMDLPTLNSEDYFSMADMTYDHFHELLVGNLNDVHAVIEDVKNTYGSMM